jgi:hypothetical protein
VKETHEIQAQRESQQLNMHCGSITYASAASFPGR